MTGVLLKPLKLDRWWVFTDDLNAACGVGPIVLDPGTEIAIENRRGPEMTYSEVISGRWDGVIFRSSLRRRARPEEN